jgi:hypothetical protein
MGNTFQLAKGIGLQSHAIVVHDDDVLLSQSSYSDIDRPGKGEVIVLVGDRLKSVVVGMAICNDDDPCIIRRTASERFRQRDDDVWVSIGDYNSEAHVRVWAIIS